MDDLDFNEFNLLVRVLSRPSMETDFKLLLSLGNIQEVANNLEEFVSKKVPRLNFVGSSDARAR